MPNNADQKIKELVNKFTSDLIKVVRVSALEAFASSFELRAEPSPTSTTTTDTQAPVRRRRRRSRATTKKAMTSKGASKGAKTPANRRTVTGGKRDPKQLEALTERLATYVASNAGQTMLEIGAALKASTADLALPTKKLLDAKRIKRRGKRNQTKYYAG